MTILIRVALSPLQQFQLLTQRRTMAEQRKLAPQVAELRKKYKKDPTKLNQEMMKLYQEHGVNPLGGLVGCAPLVVQMPILSALYFVFRNRAPHLNLASHFLFIQNLNDNPTTHAMLSVAGFGIPAIAYLVFPLLAAATTFVQTKMLQQPTPPNPTEQELQTAQMQRMMVFMSPLLFGWFALQVPAGLALYWFIGNCVGIIQQSFVVGWGNLWPRGGAGTAAASQPKGGGGPREGPSNNAKQLPRRVQGSSASNNNKAKEPKKRAS